MAGKIELPASAIYQMDLRIKKLFAKIKSDEKKLKALQLARSKVVKIKR